MAIDREKTLEAAQKYVAKSQYDKAIGEYQKLVKEKPSDVRTWLKIGDLYKRINAKREAIETYSHVGDIYAQQGDYLKAVAVCKEVLKLDPSHVEAQQKLADGYEKLSLISEAVATYEQLAALYIRLNDSDKVLETLARMASIDAQSVPVRIKYAEALSRYGKTDDAAREFEAGANLLRDQGRMDDFIKVAERLLFHRPEDAKVARELAELYLERNDAKRALSKLQVCFKANPRDVETLELLGQAFFALGQTAKTVSVLREVMRLHAEANKPAERARVAQKILDLDPQDADAKQALAGTPAAGSKVAPPAPPKGAVPPPPPRGKVPPPPATPRFDPPSGEVLSDDALEIEDGEEALVTDPPPANLAPPSVPPEVAQEAQIARLLTEVEVFSRYGLRNKVIEHLVSVLTIAPDHVDARDRLKSAYAEAGYVTEAVEELLILAELVRESDPDRAAQYAAEASALDPNRQGADVTHELADDAEASSFADQTDANNAVKAPIDPEVALAPMSPAEFDAAPLRRTIPPPGKSALSAEASDIETSLDEADFYVAQGLFSQARGILEFLLRKHAEHPLVLEKLEEVNDLENAARASLPPPRDQNTDNAFMLAERLAEELGPEGAGPELGSDVLDVDQVFAKFKQGVEETVGLEDSDTHFDLGIAYKEMGLLDDAIHEFELAKSNPQRECIAETMIGMCYMEKNDIADAIAHFKAGLYCETKSEREELGLYFELANAYEALQDPKEALYYFQKVQKRDPAFRNVDERLAALAAASSAVRAELPVPEIEPEAEIELDAEIELSPDEDE